MGIGAMALNVGTAEQRRVALEQHTVTCGFEQEDGRMELGGTMCKRFCSVSPPTRLGEHNQESRPNAFRIDRSMKIIHLQPASVFHLVVEHPAISSRLPDG